MASSMNITVVACLCFAALIGVKGQPISPPSLVTQYLTEMCKFYIVESVSGCDFENVIEDVKEYAENLATPPRFPNWNGNQVETYLDMAEKGNVFCTPQGGPIRSACAAMEAVCGPSKVNLVQCKDVTPAPPTANPASNTTTMTSPTNQPPITA